MGRGDTSDAQWRLIGPLLPKQKRGGRWNDHRLMFDGILWVLRTGAPWRDLPERYGAWGSVYHRFNRWKKDGTLDRILKALRIRLDKEGYIDWDLWCVDGSSVRAGLAGRGIEAVIPQRSDQVRLEGRRRFDRRAYRRRSRVENSVGWLKENRRVGTRYDKLASSFLAFVNLAIIRRYLRILAPDD